MRRRELKVCRWCKEEFEAKIHQKCCCVEHSYAFNKMKNHIWRYLDYDVFDAEMAKLERLGKNYKLPERVIID